MKNGNLICLGTAVLVVGAIFWRWFLPGFFFTGDTGFFFNENLLSVYNIYLWKASYLLGFPNYALPRFLIDLVTVWPTWLVGLSFNDFTLKFLFFYPFLLLSCTGSFVFLRSMKISKIISSELSVLYVISTSSVAFLSMGHIHLMVPIALFPWLVYFWMKYLSFGLLRFSASSLFVLFISGLYDLRLAFLSTIFLFVLTLFYVLFDMTSVRLKHLIFTTLSLGVVFILLNAFWLIPAFQFSTPVSGDIISRPTFGSSFWNILNSLGNFHSYWSTGGLKIFERQELPLIFFIFPLLLAAGLLIYNPESRNKKFILWTFFTLALMFLIKQDANPIQGSFSWLANHVPVFKLFREGAKFFYVLDLTYLVVTGLVLDEVVSRVKSNKFIHLLCLTLPLALIVFLSLPIIYSSGDSIFVSKTIDRDYIRVNSYLVERNKEEGFFRTLWIPVSSNFSLSTSSMPRVNFFDVLSYWRSNNSQITATSSRFLAGGEFKHLVDLSSIRYVILPKDTKNDDEDLFRWYEQKSIYKSILDDSDWLKQIAVDNSSSSILIYENPGYRSHIYATLEPETLQREVKYLSVNFWFINPTEYKIKLTSIATTTYLNFSEAYHPDWRLREGEFKWWQVLIDRNYFLDNKDHYKNDAGLNSFKIDPDKVCRGGNCELILYFRPQSYVYVGLIVSGATLLAYLSYLGYVGVVALKKKKKDETID